MEVKHVVIGSGEVGMAIQRLIACRTNMIGTDIHTDFDKLAAIITGLEYMHVAIPYSPTFVDTCKHLQDILKPKYTIIYSSVLPGTTEQLGEYAVHSPIEGRHPHLFESVKHFPRLISGPRSEEVCKMFVGLGIMDIRIYPNSKTTEIGKLLSTTRYGINLMFAQEQKEICDRLGVKYEEAVSAYIDMYNDGYSNIESKRFQQQNLTPPGDKIGGHCVIPNAKLLANNITDSEIITKLSKYNEE